VGEQLINFFLLRTRFDNSLFDPEVVFIRKPKEHPALSLTHRIEGPYPLAKILDLPKEIVNLLKRMAIDPLKEMATDPLEEMVTDPLKRMVINHLKEMAINANQDLRSVALVHQKELRDRLNQKKDHLPPNEARVLLNAHQDLHHLEEALVPLKEVHDLLTQRDDLHHLRKGLNYTLLTFLLMRLSAN
jgi:hypothetical protein